MKKLILVLLLISASVISNGQVLKLVATDTFYGSAEGGMLWLGSFMIAEGELNGGLGASVSAGIFLGLGMGIYDAFVFSNNGNPYRNGVLSETGTSMQIIGMDTFYGGAIGGLVGVAVGLMKNDAPFLTTVGKGVGYGVWGGMVFGVVDAVVLANPSKTSPTAMINYKGENFTVSSVSPSMRYQKVATLNGPAYEAVPQINLLKVNF